ncbi:MAG: malonic semialdehyde reductase [Alphaproteobacteria bacterium GM202ARS2]|nr:malonic semialdehyde reductase [Alphaproteobacteria bacterium GM202ARS2]
MERDDFLDLIFRQARSHSVWQARRVEDSLLRTLYEVASLGATSSNSCPLRLVFVCSDEGRKTLLPCLSEGNVAKTESAPVTMIFAYDILFYERMAVVSSSGAKFASRYQADEKQAEQAAHFNASLQAAYCMIVARALGLDCGPMGGFSRAKIDAAFLQGSSWRSFLLCNLGYGDGTSLRPRGERPPFDEACRVV